MLHRREHVAALGWYALVATSVFWQVVVRQQVVYWGDILLYFLPMTTFAHRWLAEGVLPLWNPHILFGQPFVGNPQEWLFYPSTLFLPLLHPARFLSWSIVLHLWIAGFGMWLFLRLLRVDTLPALFGGTAWMLCGAFVSRAQFPGMFQTIALLGWLMWATERALQRKDARAGTILAVVIALVWLAGHAQAAYMNSFVALLWWAWRWHQSGRDWHAALTALLGVVSALLLSAVHWLPMLQLLNETPRTHLSVWAANRFPLHPEQVLLLLIPDLYGTPWSGNWLGRGNYWEVSCAVGVLPVMSALSAWRTRREARFWLVLALGGLWLSLGPKGGLYTVAYYVLPGLKSFHDPARWLVVTDFAICVAAAQGWQGLRYSRNWLWLPVFLLALGVIWLWQGENITHWTASMDPIRIRRPETLTPVLVGSAWRRALIGIGRTVLVAGLAIVILRVAPRFRWLGMALLLVEMLPFAMRANPTCDIRAFTAVPHSARAISQSCGRLFVADQLPMWRRYVNYVDYGSTSVEHVRRWQEMLGSNIGMMWDIREASGYEPVTVKRGVRYYARLVEMWKKVPYDAAVLETLRKAGIGALATGKTADDWQVKCLRNQPARAWLYPQSLPLQAQDLSPQKLQVYIQSPGEVVLTDTAYPGWRAQINEKSVPIAVYESTFRSVRIASAPALLVWRYEPDTFRVGLYLSLLGWCTVVAIAVFSVLAGKSVVGRK